MQFHIHSFSDEAGSELSAQIAAMKRCGHEGMEIRGIGRKNVSELTLSEAREVKQALEAEGLAVWSIGSPIGKINIEDDFGAHLEVFRHCLELGAMFGAKAFRLFSFYFEADQNPDEYEGKVIDRMGQFLDIARPYGIVLCHENEKKIFGDIASRCKKLHEALPELRAVFDPANFIQCGQETLPAWEELKEYTQYLHIKDARPDGIVVPAGAGMGHVAEIVADYVARGGRDFTLEPHLAQLSTGMQIEKELLGEFVYPSADAAFDAADTALKQILAKY